MITNIIITITITIMIITIIRCRTLWAQSATTMTTTDQQDCSLQPLSGDDDEEQDTDDGDNEDDFDDIDDETVSRNSSGRADHHQKDDNNNHDDYTPWSDQLWSRWWQEHPWHSQPLWDPGGAWGHRGPHAQGLNDSMSWIENKSATFDLEWQWLVMIIIWYQWLSKTKEPGSCHWPMGSPCWPGGDQGRDHNHLFTMIIMIIW